MSDYVAGFKKTAAAGLAGLTLIAGSAAPAFAEEAKDVETVSTEAAPANKVSVPTYDIRDLRIEAAQTAGALASKDGNAIVYYGTDFEVYKALRAGLRDVITKGDIPFNMLLIAKPKEEVNVGKYHISSDHQLEIYTNGQHLTTVNNPTPEYALNGIRADLEEAWSVWVNASFEAPANVQN